MYRIKNISKTLTIAGLYPGDDIVVKQLSDFNDINKLLHKGLISVINITEIQQQQKKNQKTTFDIQKKEEVK